MKKEIERALRLMDKMDKILDRMDKRLNPVDDFSDKIFPGEKKAE